MARGSTVEEWLELARGLGMKARPAGSIDLPALKEHRRCLSKGGGRNDTTRSIGFTVAEIRRLPDGLLPCPIPRHSPVACALNWSSGAGNTKPSPAAATTADVHVTVNAPSRVQANVQSS